MPRPYGLLQQFTSRQARPAACALTALGAAAVLLLAAPPPAHAAVTTESINATKLFPKVKDGDLEGRPITDAGEKARVAAAIAKVKEMDADCGKCLEKMLANDRICKEGGKSAAGASTLPDGKPGCDPKAEAINIHPGFLGDKVPVEMLACVLLHEWCHTNQDTATFKKGSRVFEIECFQKELKCLKDLGQDQDGAPSKPRYDQIFKYLGPYAKPKDSPPQTEPHHGAALRQHEGAGYLVSSEDDSLRGLSADLLTATAAPLNMERPFDVLLLDGVGPSLDSTVAFVCGLDSSSDVGKLEALIVADGAPGRHVFTLALPGVHPFSMAADPVRHRLYVLDTKNKQVLRLEDLSGADGIPETPASSPFASLGGFPDLGSALALTLNDISATAGVLVDSADSRLKDVVPMYDQRSVIVDTDGDGFADSQRSLPERECVALSPGYLTTVLEGMTSVRVFAGEGSHVEVQLTDATASVNLGVIGTAVVPAGANEVVVPLSHTLVRTDYIRTLDTDNPAITGYFACAVTPLTTAVALSLQAVEVVGGRVILRWVGPEENPAAYTVERSESAQGPFVQLGSPRASDGPGEFHYADDGAAPERAYFYRVSVLGAAGSGKSSVVRVVTPAARLSLEQVSGNPSRRGVEFRVGAGAEVAAGAATLTVHDAAGRLVARLPVAGGAAGYARVRWDGRVLGGRWAPAGTYFARLVQRGGMVVVKVVVVE